MEDNFPFAKGKSRAEIEIVCMHKSRDLRYKPQHMFHSMTGLVLNLDFHTEDTYGVGDTVRILLLPDISLSEISKTDLVARPWDMELDRLMLTK